MSSERPILLKANTSSLTQTDFAERQQTFHEITRYMFDNLIWLGLWQDPDLWAVSNRLQNVEISGASPFYNVAEWDIQN